MTQTLTRPPASVQEQEPRRKAWSRAEYERLAGLGVFDESGPLELIQGDIVHKMAHTPLHSSTIDVAQVALLRIFPGEQYRIRCQLPLALSDWSEPEPDIAVVQGSAVDFIDRHPTTAALVVEVSDSTLRADQSIKLEMYATAGIPEYWIVNLQDGVLEVYRRPEPAEGEAPRGRYAEATRLGPDASVSPLAVPGVSIRVSELIPQRQAAPEAP
jgi:Uma2 family endonuclease